MLKGRGAEGLERLLLGNPPCPVSSEIRCFVLNRVEHEGILRVKCNLSLYISWVAYFNWDFFKRRFGASRAACYRAVLLQCKPKDYE